MAVYLAEGPRRLYDRNWYMPFQTPFCIFRITHHPPEGLLTTVPPHIKHTNNTHHHTTVDCVAAEQLIFTIWECLELSPNKFYCQQLLGATPIW